jgi:hypothetical protein
MFIYLALGRDISYFVLKNLHKAKKPTTPNPLEFERSDVNELFIEMLDILLIEHII